MWLGSPTVVSRHRIWFSFENVAQQDFTFAYNRLWVRANSAALRLGRGSARVAHQGGHWPSCVENSSNKAPLNVPTDCLPRQNWRKITAVRAGAVNLSVNTTRTVTFELLLMETHNNLERICERTKLALHFTGYFSCAPSRVFTIIADLRVFMCLVS